MLVICITSFSEFIDLCVKTCNQDHMHNFCIHSDCLLANMAIKGWNKGTTTKILLKHFYFCHPGADIWEVSVGEAVRGKHWPPLLCEMGSSSVLSNGFLFTLQFFSQSFIAFHGNFPIWNWVRCVLWAQPHSSTLCSLNLYNFIVNKFSCSQINVDSYSSKLAGT